MNELSAVTSVRWALECHIIWRITWASTVKTGLSLAKFVIRSFIERINWPFTCVFTEVNEPSVAVFVIRSLYSRMTWQNTCSFTHVISRLNVQIVATDLHPFVAWKIIFTHTIKQHITTLECAYCSKRFGCLSSLKSRMHSITTLAIECALILLRSYANMIWSEVWNIRLHIIW